nr:MAG TPA: MAEBL protein [Caudoviricetes sp.]
MQNNAMMAVDAAAESPLPEIDPARVVVDGLPEIDPAQVIPDKPAADPRRKKLVRKMFQEGDPFAIFEPAERKRLSELNLDVRDQKQIMLAAFFADGDGKRFDWAYSNLRGLTDQIFGKDFDTDRAFAEVCKIYAKPADQGFVMKTDGSKAGEVGHALKSGIGRIGADVLKTVKMAAEKPNALALIADLLIPNNAWQQMRERAVAMTPLNDWIDTYDKYTEYESAAANMKGDWFSNSDSVGDWVFQVLKGIVAEAPSMAVQFGAWAVSPGTGIAVTAGSSAAGKHYDLQSEEIDPRLKLLNALLTGTVNGALERITGGIIRGKGAEKVVNEGLKKGYKKALLYFGKNMLKEGAQEFSEQLAENTVDMFTGVGGGTLGERARHLLRGTGESAVIGMFYGGAGSVPGYVSALDVERRNELIRRTAEQEIERIKGIANASDEQIRQMKELQTLLESDDLGKAVDLSVTNRMKEDAARKREQEIEDADTPELGYEIADGMDKETVLKAKEAEEWLAIRNTLRHNPQDTEDAVAEASVFYRDTAFHIVHGRGDYPADVQAEMERIGKNPDQIRAFTYDGNVYVNADRVRPSEVPALLLHEVVGHKGLRAVFGKDFDLLLDSVVKEHLNDQDFRRIAEQYQCDLETVDGARYAAEEYLARYAEQHGAGVKPKWWKETLQRIRVFLSKHHLYRNVRFTDAEIEVALARSIRHTRKQWNNKTIEQGSKKEEGGKDRESARLRDRESARVRDRESARVRDRESARVRDRESARLRDVRFAADAENGRAFPLRMEHTYPEVHEILRRMQGRELHNQEENLSARISSTGVNKVLSNKARQKSIANGFSDEQHLLAAANLDRLFENGVLLETRPDKNNDPNIASIKRLAAPFYVDGDFAEAILTLKESVEHGNRVYSLELDEIRKPSSSDKRGLENQADTRTLDGYEKITRKIEKARAFIEKQGGKDREMEGDTGKGGVRFSVAPVWTGSAADYDQPSLQYIGTGEGAQVYGWGLYGSESEQVARWYAKADVERKNSAKILLDGKEYDLHEIAGVEGDIAADVLEDVLDRKGSTSGTMTFYRSWINKSSGEEEEIYRRRLEWLEKNKDRIQYVPEKEESGRRHLYRQTFFAGREENLLDWDKPVTEEQRKKIAMQLKMEELYLTGDPDEASAELRELRRRQREGEDISGEELDAAYDKASRLHAQRNVIGKTLNGDVPSGSMVYENLEEILGEPQAVSEFLYRAGIDGVTYIGNSSNVRNYVAFSDQDIRVDEHIRFSIEEYSAEEQERIIDLMRPFVGKYADKEDSEYADFLAKRGIAASEQDARYFASQAAKDNLSAARKREKEVENQWHYEHNFWIMHLTDFTGTSDFKIRPSFRFQNEDFSGTFISEPWRNKGKKFTPKNARDAERHRRKLETAAGYASDELAKYIARKTGGDELEIEQQLIDYFRNLTKPDLHKQYKAFKDSETFGDRVADREMREAWEAREENRISMELEDILTNGRQITEEYLAKEPEVVKRLAQQLLGNGERKYYKVYKNDLEAINAALRQEEGDASGYAQGYRAGKKESAKEFREKLKADREKAWEAFKERVKKLREAVMADRKDIQSAQKIQQEAWELAKELLPREHRDEFVKSIIRLSSYNNFATKTYPEGKRKAMFDELLDNMRLIGSEARKKIELERLHDRMDELVPRRSNGKTVGSRSEESQKELKLIRDIVDASDNANAARLAELAQKMDEADRNGQELSDDELLEYAYLQNFSNLEEKSPEHLKSCIRAIDSIARKGRSDFRAQIAEVMHQVARERDQFIQAVSGGKGVMSPQKADLQQAKRRKYAALMSAGEFARQNMNLEFLLSHITMNEGVEFEKSHFYESIRRVHRCRQEYKKRLTARNQDFEREFDRIFGTNGVISRGSELKRLREKSEHTGIMRHQRENPRDGIKFEWVPYAEAKQLLREYDYGERRGSLLAHEAEAIRQQISDYVQKAEKKTYPDVGDAATDEVMKFIRKDAREGMICIPRVVDPGRLVEQPFSQMEALDMWLMSRQADVAMKMRFNGWTDESMKQLEAFLEPKVKEFGLFLQKEIAGNFEALNRVYKKMYYAEMNHNPDYWMTSYSNLKRSEENTAADMGNAFKVYGVAPGMLKDRQFHLLEPKAGDAIAKWSNNAIQSEHFITHAGEVRNWRRLLNNKSVQDAITQYVGDDAYMALVEKVQIFADGGRRDIEKCRFAGLFGNWARTNVLLNIGSGLKQTAGGLAYMNDIPAGAFVKYQAAFFRHPVANAKMLMNTPYFKMRFASSGDRDLAMLMNWAASLSGKSAAYARQLTEYGSLPMRLGDAVAVLSGGWAVYKYHYDNLIKSGETHKAAHEEALLRWEMSTERTQQSSEPHNMNRFQLGGPVTRALTTYLSNPILTMQREFDTITALAKGRGGRKKHVFNLTKQIFVNHVIIPFLMELIGNFLRHRENWEEYEWARTASAMLAGPFCGVFVLGDVLETVFNTLFSRGGMMFSGGPGRDFELAARRTRKLFDEDVSGDDVYKAIESWGKAASVLPYIGIGTAVMRELRRMKEFFMPEEK